MERSLNSIAFAPPRGSNAFSTSGCGISRWCVTQPSQCHASLNLFRGHGALSTCARMGTPSAIGRSSLELAQSTLKALPRRSGQRLPRCEWQAEPRFKIILGTVGGLLAAPPVICCSAAHPPAHPARKLRTPADAGRESGCPHPSPPTPPVLSESPPCKPRTSRPPQATRTRPPTARPDTDEVE